jgi:hypothetical protein
MSMAPGGKDRPSRETWPSGGAGWQESPGPGARGRGVAGRSSPGWCGGRTAGTRFPVNSGAIMWRSHAPSTRPLPSGSVIGFAGMRMRRGGQTAPHA